MTSKKKSSHKANELKTENQRLQKENVRLKLKLREADPWDNAPMESFFGTLKTELIYQEKFSTREDAKVKIFE